MFFSQSLCNKAQEIILMAQKKELKIVTAESCTGGLIAGLFTSIAGSSQVFERGFVVYSNQSKQDILKVKKDLLENFGAVSGEVAVAMAQGALKNSAANVAISVTGIAGPDGGFGDKPVGLVYVAACFQSQTFVRKFNFFGSRDEIRKCSIICALDVLERAIKY